MEVQELKKVTFIIQKRFFFIFIFFKLFFSKVVALIRNRDCRYIVLDRGTNQQFNRLQLFKNSGEYVCRLSLPCPIDQVSVMTVNKENEQLIIVDNKNLVHAFEFETFNQLALVRQFSISGNVHEPSDVGVYKGYVSEESIL